MDLRQIKIVLMSRFRILLPLLVFLAAGLFYLPKLSNAAVTATPPTASQLSAIDCSGVSGTPGLGGLCSAIDNSLNSLGDTLSASINAITQNFINLLKEKLWQILFGRDLGIVTLTIQGLNNFLYGVDPSTYDPQSASIDQQRPVSQGLPPFKLISLIYDNPPNMGTLDALSYTVNQNILGLHTALAMDCGDPNNPGPGDFYKTHTAAEACPGRIRLNPMYRIWEGIRNISYVSITLILVIYGFMVMFRSKVDPRTVITLQSVIPRLAIGLVAIAFSYIIASLAVDIGQVGLAAVGQFFAQIKLGPPPLVPTKTGGAISPLPYFEPIRGFNNKLTIDYAPPSGSFGILTPLVGLIMGFITWFIVFQVFFALITNYAQIFVKTALGPIMIAFGIIPTQSDALAKWFKGLLANALVFPGIYFIVNIIVYIDGYVKSLYMPSPLNDDVKSFVMLGLFVVASKVPAVIEEFLGVQQSGAVSRAGTDISQAARKIPVVGSFF